MAAIAGEIFMPTTICAASSAMPHGQFEADTQPPPIRQEVRPRIGHESTFTADLAPPMLPALQPAAPMQGMAVKGLNTPENPPDGYVKIVRTKEKIESASDFFISHDMAKYIIDTVTFHGKLGEAHTHIEEMKNRLLHKSGDRGVYKLSGENRLELFKNTVATFTQGGADAGAFLGHYLLAPYDALFGTGVYRGRDEEFNFMDKGVMGYILEGLTTGIGWTGELIGGGLGVVAGAFTLPASSSSSQTPAEWIKNKGMSAKEVLGKAVTIALGSISGALLDIFRSGSLTLKYFFTTVMAIGSFFAGVFGGAARALIGH